MSKSDPPDILSCEPAEAGAQSSSPEPVHQPHLDRAFLEKETKRVEQENRKQGLSGVKPKFRLNEDGFAQTLQFVHAELRRNVRSQRVEIRTSLDDWKLLTDEREAALQVLIERWCVNTGDRNTPWRVGRERWNQLRNAYTSNHQVDPFLHDFLFPITDNFSDDLPKDTGLLDTWLTRLFDFDAPPELVKWACRYFFVAPIQRAVEPGCKLDEVPVLIGAQGCGKSAVVRSILPPDRQQQWFTDAIDLGSDSNTLVEAMLGRVVIELSEMTGVSRRELAALKSFITRQDDGAIRLAYARNPVETPRRCAFFGTANENVLPNDPTGNRRFVALKIESPRAKCRVEDFMDEHRERLFAEALLACGGRVERANLPYELAPLQAQVNDLYRSGDEALEDTVDLVLKTQFTDGKARLKDVLNRVNERSESHYSSRQVAMAMIFCDWESRRTKKDRFWVRIQNKGDG